MKIKTNLSRRNIKLFLTPLLTITFITFIIFHNIIQPKLIGHTWDWGLIFLKEQYIIRLQSFFYLWNDKILSGYFTGFTSELPYWFFLTIFSFLFGDYASVATTMCIFILIGFLMYISVRKLTSIGLFGALLSALIYTYNPFTYSRLIAGHLSILLAYAFLPVFLLYVYKFIGNYKSRDLIILVLVTPLLSLHQTTVIIGIYIAVILILVQLNKNGLKKTLKSFLWVIFPTFALNIYWIYPLIYSFWRFGDVSLRASGTVSSEFIQKLSYLSSLSHPLFKIFTFNIDNGMHTEYVYPVGPVFSLFIVSVVALYLSIVFIIANKNKINSEIVNPLVIIILLGIAFSSGVKNIIGFSYYKILENLTPYIAALFTNTLRNIPLVFLPLSIFSGISVDIIIKKRNYLFNYLTGFLVFVIIILFQYPWFFGNLTYPQVKGNQPLSLKLININNSEKRIIQDYSRDLSDRRVVLFPPAFVSWPGDTDFGLVWGTLFFPKSTFLNYQYHPLSEVILNQMYSTRSYADISYLLGLANVDAIIYPSYKHFESYVAYIPGTINYKPYVDRNLNTQSNLVKTPDLYPDVTILKNKNFLPHFYIPKNVYLYSGSDRSVITDAVSVSDYDNRTVFIEKKDLNININLFETTNLIKPICAGCNTIEIPEYEKFPKIKLLPTSFIYDLIINKENRNLQTLKENSYAQVKLILIYANKRLAEVNQMISEKKDTEKESIKSMHEFERLLESSKNILESMSRDVFLNNDKLLELQEILSFQTKQLGNIILSTRNGDISQSARNERDLIFNITSDLRQKIVKPGENTFTYFIEIPHDGLYVLNFQKLIESQIIKIWLDDILLNFSNEGDGNWTSINLPFVTKGNHKIKILYSAQPSILTSNEYQMNAEDIPISHKIQISNLDDRYNYNLHFKYQISGSPIKFTLEQQNDPVIDDKVLRKVDIFLNQIQEWGIVDQEFTPNFGSTQANLQFQFNSQNGDSKVNSLLIKDAKITKLIKPNFFISEVKTLQTKELPKITFTKINPTKYLVSINQAQNPFILIFSESFHKDWKAFIIEDNSLPIQRSVKLNTYFDGDIEEVLIKNNIPEWKINRNNKVSQIRDNKHFKSNTYSNSWYVDHIGNFDIIIEFTPQRYYTLSLIFSLITSVFLIILFIYNQGKK